MAHTPTPWQIKGEEILDMDGNLLAGIKGNRPKTEELANIKFIVMVANCYDELVELILDRVSFISDILDWHEKAEALLDRVKSLEVKE